MKNETLGGAIREDDYLSFLHHKTEKIINIHSIKMLKPTPTYCSV
jgi:hypothetical protein